MLTLAGKAFAGQGSGMGTGVGQSLVIAADGARALPVRGGFLTEWPAAGASFGV